MLLSRTSSLVVSAVLHCIRKHTLLSYLPEFVQHETLYFHCETYCINEYTPDLLSVKNGMSHWNENLPEPVELDLILVLGRYGPGCGFAMRASAWQYSRVPGRSLSLLCNGYYDDLI